MSNNHIFIFLLIITFSKQELRIPFKRHYNEDLSLINPKEFIPKIHQSNIEVILELGSNNQKIPFYLRFDQYSFFTSGNEAQIDKNLIKFNEKLSSSYKNYSTKISFFYQHFLNGYKSNDIVTFNNKKSINMNFILASEINIIYNESGVIGFKNYDNMNDEMIKDYSFISQLKELNIINSFNFVFKFLDKNKGEIIIGEKPDEYDSKYNFEKYISVKALVSEDKQIFWGFSFNKISQILKNGKTNVIKDSKLLYLKIEIDGIIGPNEYEDLLLNDFNKLINEGKCFKENTNSYRYYYCNNNVNMDFIGNLQFEHLDLKTNFTFNKEELIFKSKDGFQHFMVVFQNDIKNINWVFGKLFLEKYLLVFNLESKTIGYYIRSEKGISKSLIFIIFLILIIIFLGILLYYFIKKIPRKKRIYELENNYDYITQDKAQHLFQS